MDKPVSEMTVEEIRESIRELRERRAARTEYAFSKSKDPAGKPKEKKGRKKREVEFLPEGIEEMMEADNAQE